METVLTVKQVAARLQKSEETIKRWLRSGKFPNAYKKTNKQGWQIPQQDLQKWLDSSSKPFEKEINMKSNHTYAIPNEDTKELVLLAFQAITLTSPTKSIINILNHTGIKRTLVILLIMQQSPNKVKNPEGFIRKAISKGWSLTTLPMKKERNVARVQSEIHREHRPAVPFYNWLEG